MPRTTAIPVLDLPPRIDPRGVAEAAKAYTDLRERHRVEQQNLTELEHQRDGARLADEQAHADAIRHGKPDPGAKLTAKAEQAVAAKGREVAALKIAATDAHAELLAVVDEHRPAWAAKVAEQIEQRRAAVCEAVDALERAHRELREDSALSTWLDGFPEARYRPVRARCLRCGGPPVIRRSSRSSSTRFARWSIRPSSRSLRTSSRCAPSRADRELPRGATPRAVGDRHLRRRGNLAPIHAACHREKTAAEARRARA